MRGVLARKSSEPLIICLLRVLVLDAAKLTSTGLLSDETLDRTGAQLSYGCNLSGLPFPQASNMQVESMAFWGESPFRPKT